jgi:hypothetical protein
MSMFSESIFRINESYLKFRATKENLYNLTLLYFPQNNPIAESIEDQHGEDTGF